MFGPTGDWLAVARVPAAITDYGAVAITADHLYAVTEGSAGQPQIVRYRIDRSTPGR